MLFLRDTREPDDHSAAASAPSKKLRILDSRYAFILPIGFLLHTMQGLSQQTLGFYCEDVVGFSRIESVRYYALAMMASSIAMLKPTTSSQ